MPRLLILLNKNAAAEGQLVFAGYGVEIPGGYSDYAGIDVKGKIVVLVAGAPDGLHSTVTAHFSNGGNKMTVAFEKGAIGVIMYSPQNRPSTNANPTLQSNTTVNPEKTMAFSRGFTGNLNVVVNATTPLMRRLFMNSGKNLQQVLGDIKKGKPSSFEFGYSLSVSYTTSHTDIESYNVVGMIPGLIRF